jgi:hypothetical protein
VFKLINKENEYKYALKCIEKWSKHWLTPSARRKYAGYASMREPSTKTLKYISSLDESMSIKDKLDTLYTFFEERDKEEKESWGMGTGFYSELLSYIRGSYKRIEIGEPVQRNINR